MKRKIYAILAISIFAASMLIAGITSINGSKATKNPDCEWGCKACGKGCYCYNYYPCLQDGPF